MRRTDPAELKGYLRWFYRGWRPTRLGRIWSHAVAWLSALGLTPRILVTLQVADRLSGGLRSTVLVAVRHEDGLYVVSMLGAGSEWVQDLRAADGRASILRRRARPVRLTELPPKARAPILKAWSQVATSGRRHLPAAPDAPLSAFEAIAADYPVFRIVPAA